MSNELFSTMHELIDYIIEHYGEADEQQREQYCDAIQELKGHHDDVMDHYVALDEKLMHFFELYRELQEHTLSDIPTGYELNTKPAEHQGSNEQGLLGALQARSAWNMPMMSEMSQSIAYESYPELTTKAVSCNECDLLIEPQHELALDYAQGYYKLFMFQKASHILYDIIKEQPECNVARIYYGMCLMHLRDWDEAQRQFQLLTVLSDFPKWLSLSYNALGCIQAIKLNMNQAELLFQKAYQIYPQFEDPLKNLQSCKGSPKQLSLYFGSTELCCT